MSSIVLDLAKEGSGDWIARSQAKRLLAPYGRFQKIVLDFDGLDFIGQGFADEVFRVFRRHHPEVEIEAINASESVQKMIRYVDGAVDFWVAGK